jgi:CBS domain-containing protein
MTMVKHLIERKGRTLYSVEPEDPVLEAIRQMAEHHVGALLVMKGTELQGIIS